MAAFKRYVKIKDPDRLVLKDLPFRPGQVVEVVITDQTDGAPEGRTPVLGLLASLLSPVAELLTHLFSR